MDELIKIATDNGVFVEDKIIDKRTRKTEANHEDISERSIITFLKETVKKNSKLYYLIIEIISPICPNKKPLKKFIARHKNETILNIGSGNERIGAGIINLDMFAYENVDIVTDAKKMCVKNDIVDAVIGMAMLEHMDDPETVVKETERILRKNGECFFAIPFMFGFHASPYDFTRWTHEGLKKMFARNGFEIVELGVQSGPTSAFLSITIDFLSILLSLGIKPLYEIWTIFFMLILWPLKFLDLILIKIPFAKVIAANFYIIGRKK